MESFTYIHQTVARDCTHSREFAIIDIDSSFFLTRHIPGVASRLSRHNETCRLLRFTDARQIINTGADTRRVYLRRLHWMLYIVN